MKIVVLKFGGTSVNSAEKRAEIIKQTKEVLASGFQPVLVVSAMGREESVYSTDSLLKLVSRDGEKLSNPNLDLLLSCGEIISAVNLAQDFQIDNIKTRCLSGAEAGIITNNHFGSAQIKKIITKNIQDLLNEGIIPIVAGFQGVTSNGETATLGRGGSDTTACALGAALKAESIRIYTDVKGVMSADPKVVETAEYLKNISYEEATEFAARGAKVVHPRAVELAAAQNIPLHILALNKGEDVTCIYNVEHDNPVTGVTLKDKIISINLKREKYGLEIFTFLAKAGISLDFININRDQISFIIDDINGEKTENILHNKRYKCEINHDFVKVSIVGSGMHGIPGVMAKIVNCLVKNGIQIEAASDSYTTISVLVRREVGNRAVELLHQKFINGGRSE